jgi:hypothetical protein
MDYFRRDLSVITAINFRSILSSFRLDMDSGSYQVPPADVHKHAMGCVCVLRHLLDMCEHLRLLLHPRHEGSAHGSDGPAFWIRP